MVDTEPPGSPYDSIQWIDLIGTRFAWERVDRYSKQLAKNRRCTYLSKKLYTDHGWPDNFDSEGFREAGEIWQAEIGKCWDWGEDERRWEAGVGPSEPPRMETENYSVLYL
jgi:hypothetical protein